MLKTPTSEQLAIDNRDLRARLEKTEATLSEILSGEADALFVTGVTGAQLFTLKGADQSYRLLIENMSEGALTLTPQGLVLYANRRFAEMLRTPLERVIGSQINNWIAPENRQLIQALLQKDRLDNHREELALTAADGTKVPVYLSVSRLVLDEIDSVCMVVTDLTEQKRNEAILAAEKLSSAILEQAADAIVICDETGRIMRASEQAQTLYGKSPLGQLFKQAFPLHRLDGTPCSDLSASDTNGRQSVEARLEHNGRAFDLLMSVGYLRDARADLLGSVITLTDITERKEMENDLRASKFRLQQMAENISDTFYLRDADGKRMLYISHAYEEIFGRSCESLYANPESWVEAIHPDDREAAKDEIIKGMLAEKYELEYRIMRPDGSIRWIESRGFPVCDDAGKIVRIAGAAKDVTERKLAEQNLRESEQAFHTLAEAMPQIVWITRANGWNMYFNQQWMDYTGLTLKESLGHGWNKPFHPDDQQPAWDAWQKATATTGIYSIESRLRRADGTYRWWLVRGVPLLDADGNILKWFGTCTDIHDLKMAGLEITRANGELRESERRFTDLLGNVELVSMMLDRESRITYCNDYLLRLTGWKREEVIGKNWWDIFVPPELNDLKGIFFENLLDNKPEGLHHENDILTRSGEHRLIRWNNSVLRSVTGEVTGTASIGEDITDRNRWELEKEKYLKFFMLSTNAMCIADPYGCFRKVNPAFIQLIGYPEDELLAKPFVDFVHPEDRQRTMDEMKLEVEVRPTLHFENRYVHHDGTVIHLSWTAHYDRLDGITYATADNITERKQAEARINHLNRVLLVLSSINTLIVRVDNREELFREACNIAVDAGGFRMAMIVIVDPITKLPVSITSAGKDDELLAAIKNVMSTSVGMQQTLVAKTVRENKSVISNDTQNHPGLLFGKQYAEAGVNSMMVIPLILSGEAVGALAFYASEINFFHKEEMKLLTELAGDIAFAIDHIEKQERLNYLAYYDVLTGLANRTLFHERLKQSVANANEQGQLLAVVLLDIDRFKTINDTLGRGAGDALLRNIAERMLDASADASRLARLDADHFAVLVHNSGSREEVARLITKRIDEVFMQPFRLGESELRITAKFGIAMCPDDGTNANTLLKNAEAALKKAKSTGEQYLFYTQKMTEALVGKLALENQLRKAIDNEEFVLYYQPKVNMVSGKVISAEALIRWNDPITGLVPPGKFIPILEETGMIHEVGRWALHKAIEENKRWRAAGLATVRIAVNVSPLQLRNINFIDEVKQVVALDTDAAAKLELEITESVIMNNIEFNIATLKIIRAMGVTIAIDDFGTGFSSLSYLAKLPIDTLKIDRSFVIEMTAGPEGLALVSTIINLAHALKLKVVAEGVETEEQSSLLRLLGCDEMQGFLFSKPVPAEIFEARFLTPPPH